MRTLPAAKGGRPGKAWQRKPTAVLAGLLSAVAVFATTTQTWIHVKLAQGVVQQADLNIAGSKASTAVTALAVVALAGSLAMSIAGRVARIVVTVLIALSAAGIIASAAAVLADPGSAAAGPAGTATGVTGNATDATVTLFPVLAVVAGALLLFAALLMAVAGRHWGTRSSKYDAVTAPAAAGAAGPALGDKPDAAVGEDDAALDDIDSWDQLSRGNDPTA